MIVITFKVRRGNDLVDFEPFLRSQMVYPAELRARTVSTSTIPRCDAKPQLCSPDFVAQSFSLQIEWLMITTFEK
jgi:hypothetical protein